MKQVVNLRRLECFHFTGEFAGLGEDVYRRIRSNIWHPTYVGVSLNIITTT